MKKFNFIDLFCGAGGLSTGLKQAGFNEVFACDFNKNSTETMRKNYPDTTVLHAPVQTLTPSLLDELSEGKRIHLVAGGPPCQGFSTIGKGNPQDERNNLFQYFVKTVKHYQPEFVLFENVTGIVSKKNEKTLKKIISSFRRIGYHLKIQILEAQQYGVPQKRRRTFLVGVRDGYSFEFPEPICDGEEVPLVTLGDMLKDLKNHRSLSKKDPNYDLKMAKSLNELDIARLKCIPEGASIRYKRDEEKWLPKKLRLNVDWEEIPEKRLRENHYHRLSRKIPAPTLNTHNHHYFHPTQSRKFTLRELASIQTFPFDYEFVGSRTSIVRQIGNAVPPLLGRVLGERIRSELIKGKRQKKSKRLNASESLKNLRSKAFLYS